MKTTIAILPTLLLCALLSAQTKSQNSNTNNASNPAW